MATPRRDITGQTFGQLTVVRQVESTGRNARWLCQCECGALVEVDSSHLTRGTQKSCGCRKDEAGELREVQCVQTPIHRDHYCNLVDEAKRRGWPLKKLLEHIVEQYVRQDLA